jgi:hypothetical protein
MDSYNGILQLNRNTTDRDSGIKKVSRTTISTDLYDY